MKPEYRLVQYAFKQAGLHTTDILQCKKLSKEVLQKTGRHISAVTIFRMARPEKYNIRPYPNTIQILLDYCGISNLEDVPELVTPKKVFSFISYDPEDDSFALDALLASLLQSENQKILYNFLERLPERFNAILDQQRTISHSFANYFRAQQHSIKAANMFQELNTHPNFQIYFTMSFPDMDFVNGYFYEGLALYIKNSDVQKSLSVRRNPYTKILSSPLEKNIYHYTLYIWMSYIKNNHAGVKQMGQLLYGKDHLLPQCVEDLSEVTGTYTRYLTARILYYHVSGLWDKRQESVDSLIAYLHNSVGKCVGDHHLMFITTMACDALLLTGQSMDCLGYFLKMEPLRKCAFMEYEPSGTRFLHYGRNYNESLLVKTEYENCVFNNCNFSNYNLSDFIFEDCTFHICNLSMAKFSNTALRNVTFRDCKISGVRFDVCKPFGLSFSFAGCQLSHASFFKLSMKNAKFTNSIFHGTDFAQADLTGAVFENCDLTDALFDQTILEKADFRSSYNYSIHPEKNRINKARFSASGISGLLKHYHIIIED